MKRKSCCLIWSSSSFYPFSSCLFSWLSSIVCKVCTIAYPITSTTFCTISSPSSTSSFAEGFVFITPTLSPSNKSASVQVLESNQARSHRTYSASSIHAEDVSHSTSSYHGNGKVKDAIQKMRGVSVSIEFNPEEASSSSSPSSMEMEILSQDLRKAKVASIFTSNIDAIQIFAKEQQSSVGNFPGPCPIIYNSVATSTATISATTASIHQAIDNGAAAIVVSSNNIISTIQLLLENNNSSNNVDVICQIENTSQLQHVLDAGLGQYAFLIKEANNANHDGESDDDDGKSNLVDMLSLIPKDSVVIYSLESMQVCSNEITKGKQVIELSSSVSPSSPLSKINGLLFENACVGDDEDLKYTNFVVGGVTKKSSSTFALTGLTGSTNGHFGTLSDNVSIENAKWKRKT